MSQNPQEWFDQFPPAPDWPKESQWCARHWAPCPILGANGIGAAVELMQAILNEKMPRGTKGAKAQNRVLKGLGKLCCALGDDRMFAIWGHWPPSTQETRPS